MIPTRWRLRLEGQVDDAQARVARAHERLAVGDGSGALQAAYQAVVSAATMRVWLAAPAWDAAMIPPDSMHDRVQEAFPGLFAALATLDLAHAITSAWAPDAAAPYVDEADAFVAEAAAELARCLTAP